MIRWLKLFSAIFILALVVSSPARADELRPGYIELTQISDNDWKLVWKAPLKGGVLPTTQPILPDGCTQKTEPTREMAILAVITRTQLKCEGSLAGKQIGLSNFGNAITDVLLRYTPQEGATQIYRLTASEPMAKIAEKAGQWQVAWSYFIIGIEHIIFGLDHLLFVLCLVLLIKGGWMVAKTVTAFTLAHSITLAGTTLGWFGLPQQPVEIIIALSIIFLAVEIVKRKEGKPRLSERMPWLVAFLFGLLHGFGFAGALNEIGLPEGEVPTALLTFNIGVEFGQIVIVILAIAVLSFIRRIKVELLKPITLTGSYAIGIIATYWFIERLIA